MGKPGRFQNHHDVGFPFVGYEYVLSLLVIKEALLANGLVE